MPEYIERIAFTLPGGETPESVFPSVADRVKAIEFTLGGKVNQCGMVKDFSVDRLPDDSTILAATMITERQIEMASDVECSLPSTLTVTGLAVGDLTISTPSRTTLLPLFF